jgi:hypothetical protein
MRKGISERSRPWLELGALRAEFRHRLGGSGLAYFLLGVRQTDRATIPVDLLPLDAPELVLPGAGMRRALHRAESESAAQWMHRRLGDCRYAEP